MIEYEVMVTREELGLLLVCAERYALGRQTYIVADVCSLIRKYMMAIPDNNLAVLIADIENPLCGKYGDETIDKPEWTALLGDLKAERSRRK